MGTASRAKRIRAIVWRVLTQQFREKAMLRFLLVFLVGLNVAFAAGIKDNLPAEGKTQEATQCVTLSSINKSAVERSGCCSYHGGVCGCSGGRQQCCDGKLSPSCLCHKEDGAVEN